MMTVPLIFSKETSKTALRRVTKLRHSAPFDSVHGRRSLALLNHRGVHLYHKYSSLDIMISHLPRLVNPIT